MFRYARLMLEELSRPSNGKMITNILRELPPGLNDIYALALGRLLEECVLLRCIIFLWVVFGYGSGRVPITVEVISCAYNARPGEDFDTAETISATKRHIMEACGVFVEFYLHPQTGLEAVRSSHLTATEFFRQSPSILSSMISKVSSIPEFPPLSSEEALIHAYMGTICRMFF